MESDQQHQAWLDRLQEDVVDPGREIVDSHHHLWNDFGVGEYLLDDLCSDTDFQRGVRRLGEHGFTYDSWHYHMQLPQFLDLARAAPGTTMVLDHFGTPIGVDCWAGQREEIFAQWKKDIAEIARCGNVYAKLGGMAMPDNGWGWHERDLPPDSDEFVEAQKPWYLYAIECFGPERCMFESNFPVDRFSLSYQVFWNGAKKMVADFSEAEQSVLFSGTATKVYSLTECTSPLIL